MCIGRHHKMEFRFKNDWIDSTVTVQADGSAVERLGFGGTPAEGQRFSSVAVWIEEMTETTNKCTTDAAVKWEDDGQMHWQEEVVWYTPTSYTCTVGRMVYVVDSTPDGIVEGGGRLWNSVYDWLVEMEKLTA